MTRGERDDTLPRFDRLQVAWEDDAWLGATASCCAASFCIFVLLTVFLAEGTLHKNERVNCITVWEHNTTARSYLEDVVPDVFGLNGTEPWEVRLKDTLMFGGRTRLRCILGWTILGCLLAAGLFFFSFNLFARRVRVAYLARQYRSQGGPAPAAQPITCLPWYPLLPSPQRLWHPRRSTSIHHSPCSCCTGPPPLRRLGRFQSQLAVRTQVRKKGATYYERVYSVPVSVLLFLILL